MLVLTRKQNEGILIGNDIVVTVINIDGDKIRLGIEAPKNVRVIREELVVEIGQENKLAAHSEYQPINKKTTDA
ncbi:carbon storage regulator, CsrA [Sporobacter termitidis DSM 10068]|uniref:Translational regulator CsrA n=1 Tax=Sporobacter termitidis DSM 10068 TaxID=1123282 RepID=A0A1M5W6I7_9FIRM|nr:carbon storage regulator CsrA [Sporobacter termitidis]SHH83071.1 carbon storage regulator, CsrA [Sporobacter termitidis DSM 10068]